MAKECDGWKRRVRLVLGAQRRGEEDQEDSRWRNCHFNETENGREDGRGRRSEEDRLTKVQYGAMQAGVQQAWLLHDMLGCIHCPGDHVTGSPADVSCTPSFDTVVSVEHAPSRIVLF